MLRSSSASDCSWRAAQPQRAAHRPVRRGIAIVGHRDSAPAASYASSICRSRSRPAQKRVLEMRERKAGVSARERRVELQRRREEVLRAWRCPRREPVHVPQAAMVRLPRVERVRRFQDRAVALRRLDLLRDRRDDAVDDRVEHHERSSAVRRTRPSRRSARPRLGQLHRYGGARRRAAREPLTT